MSRTDFPERLDQPHDAPPPPRRNGADKRMLAGIGVACVLGVVGGFIMRPNLNDQPPAERVATRQAEIPREPEGLGIVVDRVPPPEPVTPLGPPAPQTAPVEGYTPQPIPRPDAVPPVRASQAPAPRVVNGAVMRPYSDVVRRPAPRVAARPSFNCRHARSQSERMVCVDPRLAAADRRLARAYSEAIQAGVPERVLRRQQDVWLGAREAASRYGPEDVARVYEARIAELQQMR
jgi:uncharacterized protein YecT (DUF1311 family)